MSLLTFTKKLLLRERCLGHSGNPNQRHETGAHYITTLSINVKENARWLFLKGVFDADMLVNHIFQNHYTLFK